MGKFFLLLYVDTTINGMDFDEDLAKLMNQWCVRFCAQVRGRLQTKLADVRKKLASLKKLEHELRAALRSCDRELRRRSPHCPILPDATTKGAG